MSASNEPAFPMIAGNESSGVWLEQKGMTLLDWFAGQALTGLLAIPDMDWTPADIARRAYRNADAILEARKPKGPTR